MVSKSNYFRTTYCSHYCNDFSLWPPFQVWLNCVISEIKLDRVELFAIVSYFLCISWSFARPQVKTHIVKLRLLLIETLISPVSSNKSGVNSEFDFCNNIENKSNRGVSRISHFLSFVYISRDHKYYWHLLGFKWCTMYFLLYFK